MAKHPVRRALGVGVTGLALVAALVLGVPAGVVWLRSRSLIYPLDQVPSRDVTLVFGAAMWGTGPSPYLQKRLDLAAALYKAGKTKVIIVSGSRDYGYNEPDGMRSALISAGVPAARIVTDYGGDDTYSSCLRARDVYGVTSLIAVTQTYHLHRAVATCAMLGLDVVGVGDDTVAHNWRWFKNVAREAGANVKLLADLAAHRSDQDLTPSDAVQVALGQG